MNQNILSDMNDNYPWNYGFLKEFSRTHKIKFDTDLFENTGIVGDDFQEMIEKFTEKYLVNMGNYLWYFHTDEEGRWTSIGGFFFAHFTNE